MDGIEKLPKWAQRKVDCLEKDLEDFKQQAREIKGDSKTNVFIGSKYGYQINLPLDSTICFNTPAGQVFEVRLSGERIRVWTEETTMVFSECSNVIKIGMEAK